MGTVPFDGIDLLDLLLLFRYFVPSGFRDEKRRRFCASLVLLTSSSNRSDERRPLLHPFASTSLMERIQGKSGVLSELFRLFFTLCDCGKGNQLVAAWASPFAERR